MTCQHNVVVGAWCLSCGAAVDGEWMLQKQTRLASSCGNCHRPLLVRPGQWTTCGACGTQTTALP
jgi:hypothetical protein